MVFGAELSRDPGTLAFGSRALDAGPSAVLVSTVTNTGSQSVTITGGQMGGSDPGEFEWITDSPE